MTQSLTNQQPIPLPRPARKPAKIIKSLARAEDLCRANGVRLTPIRRRVLKALHAAERPIGAYDLASGLAPQGRSMAPITVYRALDFLIEQGLAHRLASLNAYIASSQVSSSLGSIAFLICEGCGHVSKVSSPELSEALSRLYKSRAFAPQSKVLELTGRCAHC